MLIKILGCLIVIGCASKIGFDEAARYTTRVKELRMLQAGLLCMKNSISFSRLTMYPTLINCAENTEGAISKLFKKSAELIHENKMSIKEAWSCATDSSSLSLNKSEKDFLLSFGTFLGTSDTINQLENIDLATEKLKLFEKDATEDEKKHSKLFKTAGVAGGLFLAIFFM